MNLFENHKTKANALKKCNSSAPYTNFNWYTAHLLFQSKVKTGLRP